MKKVKRNIKDILPTGTQIELLLTYDDEIKHWKKAEVLENKGRSTFLVHVIDDSEYRRYNLYLCDENIFWKKIII
jgi:hypothetical protein